jgi:hypothetical protein
MGRCDSGVCLTKATSCMPCDEDSDCAGDDTMCLFYLCSNEFGKMDNNCVCRTGGDCESGRCEGYSLSPTCEARLADGGSCDEHSDCISHYCSWNFVCEAPEGQNKLVSGLIWTTIVLGVAGLGYAAYYCFWKRGKDGYTEVPTE